MIPPVDAVVKQPSPIHVIMTRMLPHFTLRQLMLSVCWIGVGLGGMTFARKEWDLPLQRSYDWLVLIEGPVRTAALILGWAFICVGVIRLVTPKSTLRHLATALVGTLLGSLAGFIAGATMMLMFDANEGRFLAVMIMAIVIASVGMPLLDYSFSRRFRS